MKQLILLFSLFINSGLWAQKAPAPTYYDNGVNSPWTAGIDYDLGFGGFFSYHMALLGGVSSQVNKAASFGDVYFGELQIGMRFYLNKPDMWEGTYITAVGRFGVYDLPIRTGNSPLVVDRVTAFNGGLGVYLGYRWRRNLVNNMKGFPFIMAFEPYLGYTMDNFVPFGGGVRKATVASFSVGLKFTLGFYSHFYRPGTMVTNLETGEITRKSAEPPATNAAGTNTAATNAPGTNAPPRRPPAAAPRGGDTIGRLPLGKDPFEGILGV